VVVGLQEPEGDGSPGRDDYDDPLPRIPGLRWLHRPISQEAGRLKPADVHTVGVLVGADLEMAIALPGVEVNGRELAPAVGAVPADRAGRVRYLADHDPDTGDVRAVVGEDPGHAPVAAGAVDQQARIEVLVRLGAVVDPGLGAPAAGAVGVVGRDRHAVGDVAGGPVGEAQDAAGAAVDTGDALLLDHGRGGVGGKVHRHDEAGRDGRDDNSATTHDRSCSPQKRQSAYL